MDNVTLNHTRALCARIYVEVDLSIDLVQGFPIVLSSTKCIWQEARYEKLGFYCRKCRVGEKRKEEVKQKEEKIWQPKV